MQTICPKTSTEVYWYRGMVILRGKVTTIRNKIKLFKMKKVNLLSRAEMKKVMGGVETIDPGEGGAGCILRCNQDDGSVGSSVSDCSRATAEASCGTDLSKTVCICS